MRIKKVVQMEYPKHDPYDIYTLLNPISLAESNVTTTAFPG